jgi:GPH family glycoside/pentoside/hexuronide:cation symporter
VSSSAVASASRPAAATRRDRLALGVLIAYSTAQFGLSASNTLVATQLPFFYVDTLLLPPALFGVVMLIAKVWSAFTDPVMGHLTDNTRHRWGRRRPWLLLGALPLALASFLLFSPPARTGESLFPWLLLTFVAALTFRTMVETPYQAIAPDLTPDYDERTRVATWRTTIGMLGDFTGAIVPMILLALWTPRATFRGAGLAVAVLIVVGVAVAFAGVRERADLARSPRAPLLRNLGQIVSFPIRNRPARHLIVCYAASVFATTAPVAAFRFLDRYVFVATGLEGTALGPWIAGVGTAAFLDIATIVGYFAGVFLSAPLWSRALRVRDKKHGYVFAFVYLGVVACGVFLIPRELGIFFPLLNVLVGAGALGLWMLPGAIGPDVLEWEELHHGQRHEGGFYGIWMLVQKLGAAVALFSMGLMLEAIAFQPGREQEAGTLLGLRFLYGGVPLVVAFAAALLFTRYPLTRQVYEEIRARLEQRRRGGE